MNKHDAYLPYSEMHAMLIPSVLPLQTETVEGAATFLLSMGN